jgi:hypothetical protein
MYKHMRAEGMIPNVVVYHGIIASYEATEQYDRILELWEGIQQEGAEIDDITWERVKRAYQLRSSF